jgi:hypothetical protein
VIDEARAKAIFDEIDQYTIELERDPMTLGVAYLQERVATCRNYLNKVSFLVTEVTREEWVIARDLQAFTAAYQLEFDHLLAVDEAVKKLANIEDRKSTVGYMLRDQQRKINELKARQNDVKSVWKVVSHRNKELHATMLEIRKQKSLMEIEVRTGAFYGDERTGDKPGRGPMGGDDIDADELDALLSGKDPETDDAADETPAVVEEVVEEPDAVVVEESAEAVVEEPVVATPETAPAPEAAPEPAPAPDVVAKPVVVEDEEKAVQAFLDSTDESSKYAQRSDDDDITAILDGF